MNVVVPKVCAIRVLRIFQNLSKNKPHDPGIIRKYTIFHLRTKSFELSLTLHAIRRKRTPHSFMLCERTGSRLEAGRLSGFSPSARPVVRSLGTHRHEEEENRSFTSELPQSEHFLNERDATLPFTSSASYAVVRVCVWRQSGSTTSRKWTPCCSVGRSFVRSFDRLTDSLTEVLGRRRSVFENRGLR